MKFNNYISKSFHQTTLIKFTQQAHRQRITMYLVNKLKLYRDDNSTSVTGDYVRKNNAYVHFS